MVHDLDNEGHAKHHRIMSATCKYKGVNICWAGVYMECSVGMNPDNCELLKDLACRSKGGERCLIAPGDYNNTPSQLSKTGYLEALGLTIITTNNKTCNTKNGREIDYVIVSRKYANLIQSVEAVQGCPNWVHFALRIRLKTDPYQVKYTDLWRPLPLTEAIEWAKNNGMYCEGGVKISTKEAIKIAGKIGNPRLTR